MRRHVRYRLRGREECGMAYEAARPDGGGGDDMIQGAGYRAEEAPWSARNRTCGRQAAAAYGLPFMAAPSAWRCGRKQDDDFPDRPALSDQHFAHLDDRGLVGVVGDVAHDFLRVRTEAGLEGLD